MNVGLIGTGAIAELHARAYRNIGFALRACTDRTEEKGQQFAARHGTEYVRSVEELCRRPDIDFVDICTLPVARLEPVQLAAGYGKHVQVQKPIATTLAIAREMITSVMRGRCGPCASIAPTGRIATASFAAS